MLCRIVPIIILSLTSVLASADDIQQGHYGGTIHVAINSDIRSTNPGVRRDGNTDTVLYHVAEALVAFQDDLKPAPMLAESIHKSDDGLQYRFKLRQGVKFHNGEPLTSKEVIWSWQRLLNEQTGYRCRADFNGKGPTGLLITNIKADGPYSVTFHLNKPSSVFLDRMASIQCLTAILHPSSVAKDGSWLNPVATGPYKIEEWIKGQQISLLRFNDYKSRIEKRNGLTGQKIAYFDKVVFQVVPDRISAKASVYAGNLDLVFALPLSAAKDVARREKNRKDIKIYHQDTLDWTVLLMQNNDPLLKNKRLRGAIAHAISQDLITTFSTFGYAKANPAAVQIQSSYFPTLSKNWPEYSPEKARKLAKAAGYKGEELVIQANRKFSYMFDNAVTIQAMLHAAGFNARIEVYDWASQLTNFFKGNFQLSSFGYSARNHPALVYGNLIGTKSQRGSVQWENQQAYKLLANLEAAQNEETVQQTLNQLHQLMTEEMPLIGLYNDHVMDITAHTIEGYQTWAFGRPRLWGVWRSISGDRK